MVGMRLALIGFRHGHAMQLHNVAVKHAGIKVVGACEEDAATAAALRQGKKVALTHDNYRRMLDEVECDAVGVGDYFAKRGQVILEALRRGKHVICDKPLCTRQDELEEIARISKEKGLRVGCLLDLRGSGAIRTARRLIAEGAIGTIHTVNFTAQHPLRYGLREAWYFEPGLQGGTINDIAIHAVDIIPWVTGRKIVEVTAARAWNARLPQHGHFQDGAQLMLRLDNNGGVLGDVSYLAPDACGYSVPQYWRMMFHGSEGVLECRPDDRSVMLADATDEAARSVDAEPGVPHAAIESFLREVSGAAGEIAPSSAEVLQASRVALAIQAAADRNVQRVRVD